MRIEKQNKTKEKAYSKPANRLLATEHGKKIGECETEESCRTGLARLASSYANYFF